VAETTVDGHHLYLDPYDSLDLSINDRYESFERRVMDAEVKSGNVVLDIGANIGFLTLHLARLVGPEGRVYAFEPDPANFSLLKRNVSVNGYRNVVAVPKALSDRNDKTRLYLCETNVGDHRIYDSGDPRPSVEVEAVRLDEYFAEPRPRIDFLKIDIQGAELLALRGMERTLQESSQVKMLIEFWPAGLVRCGTQSRDLLQFLRTNGFRIHHLNERTQTVEPIEDFEAFLDAYPPDREAHTNLLCKKMDAANPA